MSDEAHRNLSSYDSIEDPDTFDATSFSAYCDAKLRSADPHVVFLREHLHELLAGGGICEIGSGNSKLLYSLELAGLLTYGAGYEISASRHRFAERFKEHVGSIRVTNRRENVLDASPERAIDICLAVDVVMCLIAPATADAEQLVLRWCFSSLRPGGALVLEFCNWSFRLREIEEHGGAFRTWQEFPPPDPWEFVLETNTRIGSCDIAWDKLFLKRGSLIRSRVGMTLRSYTEASAQEMLAREGFVRLKVHDAWSLDAPMNPGEFIVVGYKP